MKILFLFWHGLGDNILASPAIRQYKKVNPDHYIGWAMQSRFQSAELYNPHIDEYHWVSDPYNDFDSFEEGVKAVREEVNKIQYHYDYDDVIIVDHKSSDNHKIHRTASEMGVKLQGAEAVKTDFYFQYPSLNTSGLQWDYDFFHGNTGLPIKNMTELDVIKHKGPPTRPLINAYINKPLWYWAELLANARRIFVVDSVYFHIACALNRKPTMAYFGRGKDIFDVVKPLHMDVESSVIYKL